MSDKKKLGLTGNFELISILLNHKSASMKTYFTAILWVCLSFYSQAQKIKYKDVFPLLYPQQTHAGIEKLRLFLAVEKNQNEAHANYQLGEYYYTKYLTIDVLSDTANMVAYADSAKILFTKAIGLIDEKELKKNDDYYQSFYRRDLRTGAFGIKISDVHLDLENKVKGIEARNLLVIQLHQLLASMSATQQAQIRSFNSIIENNTSFETFLFYMDQAQLDQTEVLSDYQNQLEEKSTKISELFVEINQINPLGALTFDPVPTFGQVNDNFAPYENDYRSWDFETWVDNINSKYRSDIEKYKSGLMRWDKSLDLIDDRLQDGITSTIKLKLSPELQLLKDKYDQKAAMNNYLELKANMLLIESLSDTVITSQWLDSTMVAANALMADSLLKLMQNAEGSFEGLEEAIREDEAIYSDHVDELYGGVSAIIASLDKYNKRLVSLREAWANNKDYWVNRNTWVAWEGVQVAIDTTVNQDTSAYQTLMIDDKTSGLFAAGRSNKDSSLFVMKVGADRMVNWFAQPEAKIDVNTSLTWMPSTPEQLVVISYQTIDSLGTAMLIKFDETGNSLWKTEVPAIAEPHHISWDEVIDQYTLYFFPEDQYPVSDGTTGYIIIDGNGQVK